MDLILAQSVMLEKLLPLSNNKNIKVIPDPERFRPIDADLQVPDVNKFKKIQDGSHAFHLIKL